METGESSYRRFLEGDKKAFDEIVTLYRPELIYFVDSYVHDIHAAEDISIDCFTFLLVHPNRYNGKTPLKSFLFILGRSRALDYLRRQKRVKTVSPEEAESELIENEPLFDSVINTETKKAVHKAVGELPDDMRKAVILFYFNDMSYAEIAKVLKKKPKQIDNLLFRAKQMLRVSLSGEGGVEP